MEEQSQSLKDAAHIKTKNMYTQYSIHSHVSTVLAKVETIFGYHSKCQGQQSLGVELI